MIFSHSLLKLYLALNPRLSLFWLFLSIFKAADQQKLIDRHTILHLCQSSCTAGRSPLGTWARPSAQAQLMGTAAPSNMGSILIVYIIPVLQVNARYNLQFQGKQDQPVMGHCITLAPFSHSRNCSPFSGAGDHFYAIRPGSSHKQFHQALDLLKIKINFAELNKKL